MPHTCQDFVVRLSRAHQFNQHSEEKLKGAHWILQEGDHWQCWLVFHMSNRKTDGVVFHHLPRCRCSGKCLNDHESSLAESVQIPRGLGFLSQTLPASDIRFIAASWERSMTGQNSNRTSAVLFRFEEPPGGCLLLPPPSLNCIRLCLHSFSVKRKSRIFLMPIWPSCFFVALSFWKKQVHITPHQIQIHIQF